MWLHRLAVPNVAPELTGPQKVHGVLFIKHESP